MNNWTFQGKPFTKRPEGVQGFVYKLNNLSNGMYYIGKKFFVFKKVKRLKGKKRRIHYTEESDWKTYWGSSKDVALAVSKNPEHFTREILHLCNTKFDCAYLEAVEQFERRVLFDPKSYNQCINLRLRKRK